MRLHEALDEALTTLRSLNTTESTLAHKILKDFIDYCNINQPKIIENFEDNNRLNNHYCIFCDAIMIECFDEDGDEFMDCEAGCEQSEGYYN